MTARKQASSSGLSATGGAGFTLPLPYRLFFLLIEPIATLLGAYFAHFDQPRYLELTHAASAPSPIPLGTSIAMSQLANLYFAFAISEALVLRSTSDIRVWKTVLFCLLVADLGHLYTVRVLGPQIYWSVWEWNAIDWGNIPFVYLGALMRVAFLAGVGFNARNKKFKRSA
ncbi:NADP-dependent alcohol dehydrogenase-like protein [Madurella fahalii]|uniref:NADP-dependent alcohol dehydrogenase-like protein n=1 Tax=Madurella fahalii TaxID=1157608 RepID=A0ABQ0GQ57_9PEZI